MRKTGIRWKVLTKGFSLLELLFVLFIVGLLVGLVAPRYGSTIDNYELNMQRQNIEDQLRQLPRRVRLVGRPIRLPDDAKEKDLGDGAPAFSISSGWRVEFSPPLMISRLGACSESTVRLTSDLLPGFSTTYKISELSCELHLALP